MTQSDKDLLLKDLCSRLPYGVKFPITWADPITAEPIETIGTISAINRYGIVSFVWDYEGQEILEKNNLHIKDVKPYLLPMSSMTEEQLKEYMTIPPGYKTIDWFNKHHFDYRCFIERGSANDATNKNIY